MGEGGGLVREVMKTIHPSPDVSDTGREKEGLKFWKLSLKCVNQSHGRGASLQVSVSVLIYVTRVSLLLEQPESIHITEILLNHYDIQRIRNSAENI